MTQVATVVVGVGVGGSGNGGKTVMGQKTSELKKRCRAGYDSFLYL